MGRMLNENVTFSESLQIDFSKWVNFNHKFTKINDEELVKCNICNLKIWLGEEEFWYYINCAWKILDITCEEQQIKNLLE